MTTAHPIETAPKDRKILAFMWGEWRIAKWESHPSRPYWDVAGWRIKSCREHQPKWWAELPAPPPEDK